VPFRVAGGNVALEKQFTADAERDGLLQVFGHPLFGGQRITLYNGMLLISSFIHPYIIVIVIPISNCNITCNVVPIGVPDGAVDAVSEYMVRFQQKHATTAI
jgi:hypothetical protein